MKETNKLITVALISLLALFLCGWLFNHFSAWIGIASSIAYIWALINYLNKQSKTKENEKI